MKLYAILISSVVMMAFATGYVTLSLRGSLASSPDVTEIKRVQETLMQKVAPHKTIDFRSLYYLKDQFQLIDPTFVLPRMQTRGWIQTNIGKLGCQPGRFSFGRSLDYASLKERQWEDYRCGRIKALPQNYFISPPYMHSKGYSYVYLALLTQDKLFTSKNWVRQNIPLFHVTEINELTKTYGEVEGVYGILKDFDHKLLWSLVKGENALLSDKYYFVKGASLVSSSDLIYRLYDRDHVTDFLRERNYRLIPYAVGRSCDFRDGQTCWKVIVPKISDVIKLSSFYVFLFSLIIVLIVMWFIFNRIQKDKKEDDRKKLALRVLTHEFRTPIANLMLISEQMNDLIDELPDKGQELSLKLSNSVHRLRRLTEMSQKYIRAENDNKIVQFSSVQIGSINDYMYDFLQNYESVKFTEVSDFSAKFDPYWVSVCLKNLVDNALTHGEGQVKVKISTHQKCLCFEVSDEGQAQYKTLKEMTSPFVKSSVSSGMGLGLNIVEKVIVDMGGSLEFEHSPTRFRIKLKESL